MGDREKLRDLAEWVARWSATKPSAEHQPEIAALMAAMHDDAEDFMLRIARDVLLDHAPEAGNA